jgi:hypothetical protein
VKLEPLQRTMFTAVTGEGALMETAALVASGALEPEDRVGIYAEMYWLRMRGAIRADYPFVREIVGEEDFEILVARHLRQRPSVHYSLGRLGADFAATVREAGVEVLPWLADLAALEWARAESFVATDAPVLESSALVALGEGTFTRSRLVASPSLRVLHPSWDVLPVWRALERGLPWKELRVASADSPLVVWRQGFAVFHVPVSAPEAGALARVQAGLDLPAVCEAFAEAQEPAQAAFLAIGSWVSEGMMSALELDAG